MKALILAAGYGTRLYPLTKDRPKPLLEAGKKPIINHLLDKIQGFPELDEVMVVTNDKFHNIFEVWAKENKTFPKPISIINDGTKSNEDRLGSMGDIEFVVKTKSLKDDLLVLGGDNLFNFGIKNFVNFAGNNKPRVSIGLFDIEDEEQAKRFGVVELNTENQVVSFEEKPQKPKSSLIAMCLYYFPAQSIQFIGNYLLDSKSADTSGDYVKWLYNQQKVFGFKFQGKWYDIGSIESYHAAQEDFSS